MRATIKNYIDALKQRREELGEENDKGFSLIELIIVVVILGVLAAIAIPIFMNVQAEARDNALQTVAANGATQAAAAIAHNDPLTTGDHLTNLEEGDVTSVTVAFTTTDGERDLDSICVTASRGGGDDAKAGPGC